MKKIAMFFMLWTPLAFSNTPAGDLQEKLNAIRTMSAAFHQVVKSKQRTIARSSGSMALARPGRFRWQTTQPMAQWVIADGQQMWVYDVELEQVSVKKQGQHLGGTAALFLSGSNDSIMRDFDVIQTQQAKTVLFDLHAKSHQANFERVTLVFEGKVLRDIGFYDQLGQHTEIRLTDVIVNPKLSPSLFQFKAPRGVDVVQQ